VIDLWLVTSNALWIIGLSLLLATASWASWAADRERVRVRTMLTHPGAQRAWGLGLALFCAGMAATGRAWWEWTLWGGLAIGALVYAFGSNVVSRINKKGRDS